MEHLCPITVVNHMSEVHYAEWASTPGVGLVGSTAAKRSMMLFCNNVIVIYIYIIVKLATWDTLGNYETPDSSPLPRQRHTRMCAISTRCNGFFSVTVTCRIRITGSLGTINVLQIVVHTVFLLGGLEQKNT